jgi:hypothetical protein
MLLEMQHNPHEHFVNRLLVLEHSMPTPATMADR